MSINGKRKKILDKAGIIAIGVCMAILCVSFLIPIYWLLSTSLKDGQLAYYRNPFGLPKTFRFKNYLEMGQAIFVEGVDSNGRIYVHLVGSLLTNSLIYAVAMPAWSLFLTLCCAYTLSKYKFKGRNFIYNLGIFVFLMPLNTYFPAMMLIHRTLGIWNNMFLHILTSPSAAFSGVTFLAFYAAFRAIPWTYAEAVFMDGGGHFTVFVRIMLPLIVPVFIAWYILGFLGSWNEVNAFLVWLPGFPNLALGMMYFQTIAWQYGASYPKIMAGMLVVMLPAILLFMLTQKLTFTKMNVGGLKE